MRPRYGQSQWVAVASILSLVTIYGTSPSAATSQDSGSCFGQPPTIVGTDFELIGTEGPDVVITGRATEVSTLGGDDLVCITGEPQGGFYDAGDGNDRVDATGVSQSYQMSFDIALGAGHDELIGSVHSESVYADHGSVADIDRDVISTGSGRDLVLSGGVGSVNEDVIDLGDASDQLYLPRRRDARQHSGR